MDDQIDNIVPILAIENKYSPQQAINNACKLMQEAHRIFDDAEKRMPVPTGNANLDKQIKRYIHGCKDLVTGVLNWWYVSCPSSPLGVCLTCIISELSYGNERYFGKTAKREGNKIFLEILL
jgi:hypothetical protein